MFSTESIEDIPPNTPLTLIQQQSWCYEEASSQKRKREGEVVKKTRDVGRRVPLKRPTRCRVFRSSSSLPPPPSPIPSRTPRCTADPAAAKEAEAARFLLSLSFSRFCYHATLCLLLRSKALDSVLYAPYFATRSHERASFQASSPIRPSFQVIDEVNPPVELGALAVASSTRTDVSDAMASPSQQSWGYHPFSSQSYRGALPDLSSSPPRDMTPPSSPPGSPTPAYRRVASLSDPFSGSAKVPSLSHHPSFGKQYPHRKHPHPGSPKKRSGKKRSLPGSPEGPSHWNDDTKPSQERGRRVLGDGGSWTAAGPSAAQDVFKRFYDPTSSDEASSDDLREVHAPLPHQRGPLRPRVGLGLGTPFEGRTTPFARVSSYPDSPFSAYGSAFPRDSQPKVPSPGSQPPAQQRRRLGGSSPKKLTREAGSSGSSDGDGDETILPSWEMREERRSTSPELDWARVIHEAFDKVDTKIELR